MYYLLFFIIVFILFLKATYWDKIAQFLFELYLKSRALVPQSDIKRAENLVLSLSSFPSLSIPQKSQENLPDYKYFTKLILDLYQARRIYGAQIQKIVFKIKSAVLSDLQFEKKMSSLFTNSYAQFISMAFLTWGFIYLTSKMIGHSASIPVITIIISMQISGAIIFYLLYIKVKKQTLIEIGKIEAPIYSMRALIYIGIPISTICEKCEIDKLWCLKDKAIKVLVERLFGAIDKLKTQGAPIESTLNEIIDEIYFIRDQKFIKFLSFISFLKFIILALFYLTSYFIFIISLFSSLMADL